MPKYVSGCSTCPDISLQPSRLEFLLDTKQLLSVLYQEESQIGINKQETQQRGTLSVYWKLARVSRAVASILWLVRNQIFHNNGDSTVNPDHIQSCRYIGIYTPPLLQDLTLPFALGVTCTSCARKGAKKPLLWVVLTSQKLLPSTFICCWSEKDGYGCNLP